MKVWLSDNHLEITKALKIQGFGTPLEQIPLQEEYCCVALRLGSNNAPDYTVVADNGEWVALPHKLIHRVEYEQSDKLWRLTVSPRHGFLWLCHPFMDKVFKYYDDEEYLMDHEDEFIALIKEIREFNANAPEEKFDDYRLT